MDDEPPEDMAPPEVGTRVHIPKSGVVTRHNPDGTLNVKTNGGRGRPHKVRPSDIVPRKVAVKQAAPQQAIQPSRRRWIGPAFWSVTVGGIAVGVFNGLGAKLFEMLWSRLGPLITHIYLH
jgi:hypothetical protein